MFDGKAFGEDMVAIVRGYVDRVMAPLIEANAALQRRIEELEARPAAPAGDVRALVAEEVTKLPAPKDGVDAPAPTMQQIDQAVSRYFEANPPPAGKNGRDGNDGRDGEKGQNGRDGTDGKDGVGLAGALIDRDGSLVITLTDGSTKHLGSVIGKNGRDGQNGRDGADGLGFDDMELAHDGEREFIFRYSRGDVVKEAAITMPVMIDRGVYKTDVEYQRGDAVTWAGSLWIAQEPTKAKPDSGEGWRLAVKRGRDGKDAPKSHSGTE